MRPIDLSQSCVWDWIALALSIHCTHLCISNQLVVDGSGSYHACPAVCRISAEELWQVSLNLVVSASSHGQHPKSEQEQRASPSAEEMLQSV